MSATPDTRGRAVPFVIGAASIGLVIAVVTLATARSPRADTQSDQEVAASSTIAVPENLGSFVVTPIDRSPCGTEFPLTIEVPDAEKAFDGPAPSTPPLDHQLARHWVTPKWTVEARWPADRRALQVDDADPMNPAFVIDSWVVREAGALFASGPYSGPNPPVIFTVKNVEHLDLSGRLRACGELQIRVVTAAGASQTVGIAIPVRSGQGAVYDLDPLVGQHSTSRAVVSRDRSTKCPDKIDSVATVSAEVPSATPMEALRDFLESDVAADVPRAELPRPFEETYLESDGTFRYEHYLAWSEYVAITVDRMGGGWAVTNWEHGAC